MSRAWTPDAGDVVWVHLDPQVGREQAGHRPAVVLTPASYNAKSGLLLCVPLTTRIKGYPFEVPIAGDRPSASVSNHSIICCVEMISSSPWLQPSRTR